MSLPTTSTPPSSVARLPRGRRTGGLRTMGGLFALITVAAFIGFHLALAVPPWQHYDEPAHFETAKLIADRLELPKQDDFDPHTRRQVMGSMVEFGFFRAEEQTEELDLPNLLLDPDPILGFSQIDDQPLYYVLIAVPIRLASEFGYDVVMQLYAARLASSLHLVVVVVVAFLTAGELFGAKSRMRWALPIAVLATPAFTESLSGLNNDAAAAVVGSLIVWVSTRIYRRGWTLRRGVGFVVLVGAAVVTKSTVLAVLPFSVVLLILHLRIPLRVTVLAIGALAAITAAILVDGNGAADWLSGDGTITRAGTDSGPSGSYAFEAVRSETASVSLQQRVSLPSLRPGVQAVYTLGAWMWTDGISDTLPMPLVLNHSTNSAIENLVRVDGTPRWHTATITLQNDWRRASIMLLAPRGAGRLYFDDVRLVAGNDLEAGIDLIANGSAEEPALRFRSTTTNLESVLLFDPGRSIGMLQSERHRDRYLWRALQNIVDSFWARFGWGNIGLDEEIHVALTGLTVLSFLLTAALVVRSTPAERRILAALWFGALFMWTFITLRGVGSTLDLRWLPSARYGMPGILITWLLLLSGWRAVAAKLPQAASVTLSAASLGLLLVLNGHSYVTIRTFFDAFAKESFVKARASQGEWRIARNAIVRGNVPVALEAARRYAVLRKGNLYAPYAAVEMLVPACGATRSEPLCAAAVAEWKRLRGSIGDSLRRSEVELTGRGATEAGWVELAERIYDERNLGSTCDAWRLTLASIAADKNAPPARLSDDDTLRPGQMMNGDALRFISEDANCGKSLGNGKEPRWAYFWAQASAAIIAHVPVDGTYRLSADLAGTHPPIKGVLSNGIRDLGSFTLERGDREIESRSWDVELTAGWHRIEFRFTNDIRTPTLDRNLFVATVRLDELP